MPETNPRFLYVGNHIGYFLKHRVHIAEKFNENGFEIHVATPGISDNQDKSIDPDDISRVLDMGFHFHPLPLTRRGKNIFQEIATVNTLLKLYSSLRPEIIYHATIKPIIYGGFVARLIKAPAVLFTVTGMGAVFSPRDRGEELLRFFVERALKVVFNYPNSFIFFENPDDQKYFMTRRIVAEEKSSVVRGAGVNTEVFRFTAEPEGVPVVLLSSRMIWDKGIREFVTAAEIIKGKGTQVRFVLVGEGDPGNPNSVPRDQLNRWNDDGSIEWWGWSSDMPGTLKKRQLSACLPTTGEGTPTILVEAGAVGRALIATDWPGCREIVRNNVNGILVTPRDVDSLTAAIEKLLNDDDLRLEFAKMAREIVENEFSARQVAEIKYTIARKLLNEER